MHNAPKRRNARNVSYRSPTIRAMTRPTTETHLLKGSEVCDLLHISKTTRHQWTVDKRLTAIRHHDSGPYRYPANQPIIANALRAVGSLR